VQFIFFAKGWKRRKKDGKVRETRNAERKGGKDGQRNNGKHEQGRKGPIVAKPE